jgi:molybdopterin-guanine dinucleotide biosynthesis protein
MRHPEKQLPDINEDLGRMEDAARRRIRITGKLSSSQKRVDRGLEILHTTMSSVTRSLDEVPTPLLNNLRRLENPEVPGTGTVNDLLLSMLFWLKHKQKKAVVAVIGTAGVGKTSVAANLLTKLTKADLADFLGRPLQVTAVTSEESLNVAKLRGDPLKLGRRKGIRQTQHGMYSEEEYDVGSAILEKVATVALQSHDIVVIDTPGTTGVEFNGKRYGKNRGASAIKNLAHNARRGNKYDFYLIALIPGLERQKVMLFGRQELEGLSVAQRRQTFRRHRTPVKFARHAPPPGASNEGTLAINDETNEVLLALFQNKLGLRERIDRLRKKGMNAHSLNTKIDLRRTLFGELFKKLCRSLNLSPTNFMIAENEMTRAEPNSSAVFADHRLLNELSFIRRLTAERRLTEINPYQG